MDVDAGQSPFWADPAWVAEWDRRWPEIPGPSGVMTSREEDEFWADLRATYPQWFAEQDAASLDPVDPAESGPGGWEHGGGAVRMDRAGRAVVDAELLACLAPSGLLMDLLDTVDPADETRVDDAALVELVAAWQRIASAAHARAAQAAAALSERACLQVSVPIPVGKGRRRYTTLRATGTEIAMRTGCSVRSGELLARDGRLLGGQLQPTGDALAVGLIDPVKARIICDRLADQPIEIALAVQDAVLPTAPVRSWAQLAGDVERALITVDPDEAERRHEGAAASRRVCRPRRLPDGMAGIWAVLPADHAAAVDAHLDAAAAAARAGGRGPA